jgi:hypothetical protein
MLYNRWSVASKRTLHILHSHTMHFVQMMCQMSSQKPQNFLETSLKALIMSVNA